MNKRLLVIIIVLTSILFFSTAEKNRDYPWAVDYLSAMNIVPDNPELQEFSFEVSLSHNEYQFFNNVTLSYKINDAFSDRMKEGTLDNLIPIGTMKKRDVFHYKGKIPLNTQGLTKKQIKNIGSVIDSFTVTWKQDNKEMKQKIFFDELSSVGGQL